MFQTKWTQLHTATWVVGVRADSGNEEADAARHIMGNAVFGLNPLDSGLWPGSIKYDGAKCEVKLPALSVFNHYENF